MVTFTVANNYENNCNRNNNYEGKKDEVITTIISTITTIATLVTITETAAIVTTITRKE